MKTRSLSGRFLSLAIVSPRVRVLTSVSATVIVVGGLRRGWVDFGRSGRNYENVKKATAKTLRVTSLTIASVRVSVWFGLRPRISALTIVGGRLHMAVDTFPPKTLTL